MAINRKQEMKERGEQRKAEKDAFRKKLLSAQKKEKELQKLLRKRNSFINLVPVAIMAIEDGKIVEINKMVERDLGYTSEELVGRPFIDVVDPDSRETAEMIHGKGIAHESVPTQYEADLIAKDGSISRFDVRIQKVRQEGKTLLLTRMESIQERNKKEKERIQAGKADALMSLAAGVAASLCSPLAVIAGSARSLKRQLASGRQPSGEGPQKTGEGLQKIEDAASELTRLSQVLGQYSSDDQNKSKATLCDLREIVKDVISEMERQKETGIQVKTYLRPVSAVEADPKDIREMLAHLITNGIEAMPEGGDLYLSTEENAGYAHIFIQDNGKGIPDDLQARVLDPFFTTKGSSRSGLGLSLSQGIIRRYQGILEITSRKGHGTIVSVRMPLAGKKGKKDGRIQRRKIRDARILVIEDDHMIRELLSHLLKSKGFKVITAASSAEGLQQLKRKALDLVIIGSETPDVEGPVLAREIKRLYKKLPVALIVGHEAPEDRRTPEADLIITKPLDMSQVVSDVSRVLISRDIT